MMAFQDFERIGRLLENSRSLCLFAFVAGVSMHWSPPSKFLAWPENVAIS